MPSERDYAERLRELSYKTLSPQIKDLEEEVKELSSFLPTRVQQIERKLEAISKIELPTTDVVLNEILEDVLRQKDQEEKSIVSFTRDINQKETQEEILGLLLDYANKFSQRVALFAIRNNQLVGWSSRGYSEESAKDIAGCILPCSEYPQFEKALKREDITAAPDLPDDSFLSFLQAEPSKARYLAPLYVLERPVALIYMEEDGETRSSRNTLSLLIDMAVFRLENIALRILNALTVKKSSAKPQPEPEEKVESVPDSAPEPALAEPEPSETAEQVENTAKPEPYEAAEQTEEAVEPESYEAAEQTEETVEPESYELGEQLKVQIEKVAEPGPESEATEAAEPLRLIPQAASEVPEEQPDTPMPHEAPDEAGPETAFQETQEPATQTQEDAGETPPQETLSQSDQEDLHADAKRFARLLVSEIKLYNENNVAEGRRNNDLYLRLKRDIDKSREMYENRISPIVSQKIDYLHDEIIRILGNNDPSTLGSDYPGPHVEAKSL
ncbi:MAG: hypothetical protein P8Y80_07455 [Acidobacteriota bacterium]|jgi:hypothetical protein